ncbi:MAG: hypothetical protein QOH12_3132 [Solirubrobacteraceae bacterium]|jgi:hypothetical protein|nr:hypothetical protein [Solirubrobacteraceae bacterium]
MAGMTDDELLAAVRELRGTGRSPKEIARALGLRPAAVADLVRTVAAERAAVEPPELSCLVSPGWDIGLSFEGHPDWPSDKAASPPDSGLVMVLVIRKDRNQGVSVCGYLLDVYCLGVKNTIGPRRMPGHELRGFAKSYFSAWDDPAQPIPLELARHLVFGAADYARSLGFAPHPDFAAARRVLDPWDGPSSIHFGRDGKPCYTEGPYDDARHVIKTLESTVGAGNFHFTVSTLDAFLPAGQGTSRRLASRRQRPEAA